MVLKDLWLALKRALLNSCKSELDLFQWKKSMLFDREYVVRRGLRSDFVVVVVVVVVLLDWQEHLYESCLKLVLVKSGCFQT